MKLFRHKPIFQVWSNTGVYKGINQTKPVYSGVNEIQTDLKMNIREAKSISLTTFMDRIDCRHVRIESGQYWYRSPLHRDSTPSFKVNPQMNLWYDFGLGTGGDIIDLGKQLYKTEYVSEILHILGNMFCGSGHVQEPIPVKADNDKHQKVLRNLEIQPLRHVALHSYLTTRGIDLLIAAAYCNEAHYNIRDRRYFALAFKNDSGGFELRNPMFKGTCGQKDVTQISCSLPVCCVFEGFMDFLSYMTLKGRGDSEICLHGHEDYLILNSVAMLQKALPKLEPYAEIHCYLDHDQAGRTTTDTIAGINNAVDESFRFEGYKDLNDYLCHNKSGLAGQ